MRVFTVTTLIHGYYKTFVIISLELCDLSQKFKYQFGLLYSFRNINVFKSSKAHIKYVSKPKLEPFMSTRRGPYDRPPGPYDGRRCLLLILIV